MQIVKVGIWYITVHHPDSTGTYVSYCTIEIELSEEEKFNDRYTDEKTAGTGDRKSSVLHRAAGDTVYTVQGGRWLGTDSEAWEILWAN